MMEVNKWDYWEKTRVKGTLHYVVVRMLIMNCSIGLGLFIFNFLIRGSSSIYLISDLLFFIIFSLIFSFIFGLIDWFFWESAYQRSRKNKDFNIWIPKQKHITKISD